MSEAAWVSMEETMEERAKRMTGDELALTAHKAIGGNVIAQTTLALHGLSHPHPSMPSADQDKSEQQKSLMKSIAWLRLASSAGFAIAQTELANAYSTGHGAPRDVNEARRLLTLAAAANYPRAKRNLATQFMEPDSAKGLRVPAPHAIGQFNWAEPHATEKFPEKNMNRSVKADDQ